MIGTFWESLHEFLINRMLHNVRWSEMDYQNGVIVNVFAGRLMGFKRSVVSLETFEVIFRGNIQNAECWSGIVGCSNIHRMDNCSIWQFDVFAVLELAEQRTGRNAFVQTFFET